MPGGLDTIINALKGAVSIYDGIRLLSEILGVAADFVGDPSPKCQAVLARGLTPEVCRDFREIRRWVMCRTWSLLDSGVEKTFRDAIRRAWKEAESTCMGEALGARSYLETGAEPRLERIDEEVVKQYIEHCREAGCEEDGKCRISCLIEVILRDLAERGIVAVALVDKEKIRKCGGDIDCIARAVAESVRLVTR